MFSLCHFDSDLFLSMRYGHTTRLERQQQAPGGMQGKTRWHCPHVGAFCFFIPCDHLSPLQADFYLNDREKGAGGVQLLQPQGKIRMLYAQVNTTAKK